MCKHEEKHCPRCKTVFECKPGSITQCQCSGVSLSEEERAYIEAGYDDCLCIHCLRSLQRLFSKKGSVAV
ncbi:MAG: cysteine-rich CWC family protein [Ferruginibacter sp.]|mgnify:CR=1 FL=1|nr:cysteine-rich CWC family protein [Chitinophagaceae bacterium]MBP6285332.1 cysteine-rich CWC family protein [Ferruginibacter sp.]MBU9935827.1 cysteine-rich CWC family protein [Ferruginibacter sp.]HQY12943.1 cysteine-rich CWC family protein [Ferruginibacter sp.]